MELVAIAAVALLHIGIVVRDHAALQAHDRLAVLNENVRRNGNRHRLGSRKVAFEPFDEVLENAVAKPRSPPSRNWEMISGGWFFGSGRTTEVMKTPFETKRTTNTKVP
jgi:hypothetical protein